MSQSDYDLVRYVNQQINKGKVEIIIPGRMLPGVTDKGRQAIAELASVNGCKLKFTN